MYPSFVRFVRDHGLMPRGSRGIVAFSGGPDSLCLLALTGRLTAEHDLEVRAVHVDHGLRVASAAEADAAAALARQLGVGFAVRRLDGLAGKGGNVQQRAREARLQVLAEEAARSGAQWVALGHTADDQAETVLMRALRGAGPRGLAAMAARSGGYVRPLLWARRATIVGYLERHELRALEDPTNAGDDYLRNRVRHQLLPWLARENARVVESLNRLADSCREEAAAVDALAAQLLEDACGPDGLELAQLRDRPAGVLHRVLALHYESVQGSMRGLSRSHLLSLAELARGQAGSRTLDLPGVRAQRRYDRLLLRKATRRPSSPDRPAEHRGAVLRVGGPGRWRLSCGRVLEVQEAYATETVGLGRDALPLSRLQLPLTVRGPRAGDRVAVGPDKSRKLGKILIDTKVPRADREALPVVVDAERVLLIVGVRRAFGLGPRPGERVLRFSLAE